MSYFNHFYIESDDDVVRFRRLLLLLVVWNIFRKYNKNE